MDLVLWPPRLMAMYVHGRETNIQLMLATLLNAVHFEQLRRRRRRSRVDFNILAALSISGRSGRPCRTVLISVGSVAWVLVRNENHFCIFL